MLSLVALSLFAVSLSSADASQSGLSSSQLVLVKANMMNISTHSWEIGAETEALLELDYPSLSVFGDRPIPPVLSSQQNGSEVIKIAQQIVANKAPNMLPLIDGDGAAGDPASLGVSVLLTNWTRTNLTDQRYAVAVRGQLEHLLQDVPKTSDGAISQREDQIQLWADYVYMVPPFLAYYGALQQNVTLLTEAYNQCRLYRKYLQDARTGLWMHIVLGNFNDLNLWGTGNAWAAAGMLRVRETLAKSKLSLSSIAQQGDLETWINEILVGAWKFQAANGTLFNYINQTTTSFPDSSSTALLAAVTYRMASITGNFTLIPAANKAFNLIQRSIDSKGFLTNVVDPLAFNKPGKESPEGQSFTILLQSAWRDFDTAVNSNLTALKLLEEVLNGSVN